MDFTQLIIVYILIVFLAQVLLKLLSLFGKIIHRIDEKHYPDQNGFEDFYFLIYFFIYLFSLGVIYTYTALNYEIYNYIFLVLAASLLLSFVIYKGINPALTKLISTEDCFTRSKRALGRNVESIKKMHYFMNTFFQISIIICSVIVIVQYIFKMTL